jgi:DNA uptake protein ComE-like DNA-binding protein
MSDEVVRKEAEHSPRVEAVRQSLPRRYVESFRFNPNTVSHDDLCRLGFSSRQAQSIINYREKGGRFRRKSDFAKSFVVADSVYARLEPYIDIPLLDLNLADSAAFDGLPGIGGYFASKMVSYREQLKGYSYKEQLMDIWRFDQEKFEAISDLVVVSPENITPYPLWTYPADSLRRHPYIRNYETARAIVLYRENTPPSQWSIKEISAAGILSESAAEKLSRCHIAAQ